MPERVSAAEGRRLLAKSQGTQPETAIKKQVRQYLTTLGWYVFPILQGMGAHKGISDLIAVKDGRVVFLEAKTAKGKQSDNQVKFQAEVESHGGEYRVVRCVEDVMDLAKGDRE